ncbi:cardiolipin synthase ClsB [Xylophilus rhododendri]|uniref:Cardiolipin synthase B n=1 Tax=Xylophilus rhododendri TaxID=2697032 RepID=A0A857J575_9BURK|nr:cardiolipin synthase ClsB [Xylophilus rhododendri]QHI98847.1 cardiolipin synthase ClsB [Xylophilus rhododendri]
MNAEEVSADAGKGGRRLRWIAGNDIQLLENGEEFFPRVFECIANAQREVVLETFILFEDKVGKALHAALLKAARRGVKVDVMVDGFGSPDLSREFLESLTSAGVRFRVYDPGQRILGKRVGWLRRMHRKIVVVDGERAFVGGINYSADHLADFGPEAKQDYAVEITGPLVGHIHRFALHAIAIGGQGRRWFRRRIKAVHSEAIAATGPADAFFVTRDNHRHTNDIERQYRAAIRAARQRVVIANAYFFPGYRLIQEMRRAARRGVQVDLILQGQPDMPIVKIAASMLYHHLLHAGVRIHEYCDRPLHGKVAVMDDSWATVGSSNLDPLSLSLNLESNVVIRDKAFNHHLYERLAHLMQHSCKRVERENLAAEWSAWRLVRSFFVFHFLRWYPIAATWLPNPRKRAMPVQLPTTGETAAPVPTRTDAA